MTIFFLVNPQINFKANISVYLSQSVLAARHNLNHKLISITISCSIRRYPDQVVNFKNEKQSAAPPYVAVCNCN